MFSEIPLRPIDSLLSRSLTADTTPEEEQQVLAWRCESLEHEAEYRELQRLLGFAARLGQSADIGTPPTMADLAGVIGRGGRPAKASLHLLPAAPPAVSRWWQVGAAIAAAVIVTVAVARLIPTAATSALGVQEFVADQSGATTATLRDGSVVRLAPGSRLRLESSSGRAVFLEGRAFFAIARDPRRPFRIRSSAGEVTVLGTRFDLSTQSDSLRLIVLEGRVSLTARGGQAEVVAGETGRILKGAILPVTKEPQPQALLGWIGDFLAFQSTPLRQVAREVEGQYGVHFELTDSALGDRTVTGWFSGWALDDVLRVVCTVADVRCTRKDHVVMVERL